MQAGTCYLEHYISLNKSTYGFGFFKRKFSLGVFSTVVVIKIT